jgi:hypothetical protein
MLGLRFFNDVPPQSTIIRGEAFWFLADTIERKPSGDVIARHIQEQWLVGGEFYLKIECSDRVECVFVGGDSARQRRGPYQKVAMIDGVLTADGAPLALLVEHSGWRSLVGPELWSEWHLLEAVGAQL